MSVNAAWTRVGPETRAPTDLHAALCVRQASTQLVVPKSQHSQAAAEGPFAKPGRRQLPIDQVLVQADNLKG